MVAFALNNSPLLFLKSNQNFSVPVYVVDANGGDPTSRRFRHSNVHASCTVRRKQDQKKLQEEKQIKRCQTATLPYS
jgi:hypothetical protein